MKKAWIASLLILALFLSLAACGSDSSEAPFDPNSLSDVLTAHGFTEQDFPGTVTFNDKGDIILSTTLSHEEAAKACYDACKKIAQDGVVRDADENPIEFAFKEVDELQFCYYLNDKFEALSLIRRGVGDQETGMEEYQLFWE
ncbi:MAG: hypothetical protein IJJ99_03555 [Oscillospiraceae bacterium]|nr:hypothetical protein [Oscillospiraceae bacterium]